MINTRTAKLQQGIRLNRKVALAVILIALTLTASLVAVAYAQSQYLNLNGVQVVEGSPKLAYILPIVIGAGLNGNTTPPLNQQTRLEIYMFVKNNPGIHFRGVCNGLGLSVGVVQYHLGVLEQAGLVTAYSDGQNKRYFETKVYTAAEVTLISLLRHETKAKILWILAENGVVLHRDIAESIGLSSQALTWQMNQLKKTGLINAEREGVNVKYSLNETTGNTLRHLL